MLPQLTGFLFSRKTLAALALGAPLLPSAATADSKSVSISDLETPYLYVESNGSDYTGVSGLANIVAEVRVIVDTQDAGRVVSWRVVLSLRDENSVGPIFSTHAIGDSYDLGERPRRINLLEPAVIPASLWGSFITTRCNMLADELRAQGLANSEIFEENRSYELFLTADISANTNGAGSGNILDEGGGVLGPVGLEVVAETDDAHEPALRPVLAGFRVVVVADVVPGPSTPWNASKAGQTPWPPTLRRG